MVKAGELVNKTLVKEEIMPKVLKMYEKKGRYYSEQEALIGYVDCINLRKESINMESFKNFTKNLDLVPRSWGFQLQALAKLG